MNTTEDTMTAQDTHRAPYLVGYSHGRGGQPCLVSHYAYARTRDLYAAGYAVGTAERENSTPTTRVARTADPLHSAHAVAERVAAGTLVHDGWDGASIARYVLHLPCGCRFTRDGRVLLHVTPGCLAAAVVDAR